MCQVCWVSHFSLLVVSADVRAAMAPFMSELTIEPFVRECYCRFDRGAKSWTTPPHAGCGSCGGAGEIAQELNPVGRWDAFTTTRGELVLRSGCRPLREPDEYIGLSGHHHSDGATAYGYPARLRELPGEWDQARMYDVQLDALLVHGASAALIRGIWHEAADPWLAWPSLSRLAAADKLRQHANWDAALRRLVEQIDVDETLSLIDCHW